MLPLCIDLRYPHHILKSPHVLKTCGKHWNVAAVVREFMFCKVMVWKGYFCNWLRKNDRPWQVPPLNYHKILNPPFCPPTRILIKKVPPLTSSMKFWSPHFYKRWGRKRCGKSERNKRAGSCILAVKRKGEFECICQKRKICVVSERSGSCILNIFIRSMFKTWNTM